MIADFHDLLSELMAAEAQFLVVGAHALSAHGVPRATVDLDIWVRPSAPNAKRVYAALAGFGAPLEALGVSEADFVKADLVSQFGLPPYRIDMLTGISGVTFDAAWPDRIQGDVEGVRVPIIGLAAFVANKRATGRTKDLADLEALGLE